MYRADALPFSCLPECFSFQTGLPGKETGGPNPPIHFHCHPRTQYTLRGMLVNMKKAHIFCLLPSKTQNHLPGRTLLPKLRRELLDILLKISYTIPVYPVPGRVSRKGYCLCPGAPLRLSLWNTRQPVYTLPACGIRRRLL